MLHPLTLKNGARVHLVPFKGTKAATLLVLFKIGSRNEALKVWGGSHFIEHLMFKGTKRRPETIDISKELDRYGAEYNAYTGKDVTGYWVKIDTKHLPVAIDLLHDMLFHSKFEDTEMTREKKVIIEEIKMHEENPIMHVDDLLEEAMFADHVLGRNIAGTAKSVTQMKRSDILAYRDAYYVPENMVIVLAGNIPKEAKKFLDDTFGQVPQKPLVATEASFVERGEFTATPARIQQKPVEQIQVAFGFPTPGRGHNDQAALQLLSTIFGGTMSARLFIEVREKRGLCYFIRSSFDAYSDVGIFSIRSGLDARRLPLATKVIMNEVKKLAKHGVTEAELKQAKDHIRGAMTLRLEDSSNQAEFVGQQELFLDKVKTPEERLKDIAAVTRAEINRVARQTLNLKKFSCAAVGPYKSEKDFLKHLPTF